MPERHYVWLPREDVLTFEEIASLLDAFMSIGVDRVRLPGERGLQRCREQIAHGVALYPTIMPTLAVWAEKYGVPVPAAIVS